MGLRSCPTLLHEQHRGAVVVAFLLFAVFVPW